MKPLKVQLQIQKAGFSVIYELSSCFKNKLGHLHILYTVLVTVIATFPVSSQNAKKKISSSFETKKSFSRSLSLYFNVD